MKVRIASMQLMEDHRSRYALDEISRVLTGVAVNLGYINMSIQDSQ